MRDAARIERITKKLQTLWYLCPDLRLGQVISLLKTTNACNGTDPFYIEDDKWEEIIDNHIRKFGG